MKTPLLFLCVLFLLGACHNKTTKKDGKEEQAKRSVLDMQVLRMSMQGPVSLNFSPDGTLGVDFGNDSTIEVVSNYAVSNDTITFTDLEGVTCPGPGVYKMYQTDYYISFDLITDTCSGRVKSTMGFWVYPDFSEKLQQLNEALARSGADPALYLNRARMYMATADPQQAREDFTAYLDVDSTDSRVYINRAGTWFPDRMDMVITDCNKVIDLDPENKNAWFLRGLAKYSIGMEEEGCADFQKAIDLGFSVLKQAESERCKEFWE
ncbi:tetratricopeptide repeat protein [Saccharicrinis sp. FJH54]|uniref:tetratricopeptide repeat protein n=1 Tax=Saccharicrinis sp. FJH54 TaxID=3344665 RepID=UPI0035D4CAE2